MGTGAFDEIAVLIVVAGLLATIGVLLHQPLPLAYLLTGVLLGPPVLGWVKHVELLHQVSNLGVTLLLFLAGMVLSAERLRRCFKAALGVTLGSTLLITLAVSVLAHLSGIAWGPAFLLGLLLSSSSTILVVKLLPTTTLHHQRIGTLTIAILILQDIVAVLMLVVMRTFGATGLMDWLLMPVKAALLYALLYGGERWILRPVMGKIEKYQEALLLLTLSWCFGGAMLGRSLGFSLEMGSFLAGLALAQNPLHFHLADRLRFFRDFFLVLFFFTLGAQMELGAIRSALPIATALAVLVLVGKPQLFALLFRKTGEQADTAKELGYRLGQNGEFAIIGSAVALELGFFGADLQMLVLISTILTLLGSSWYAVRHLPTPLGVEKEFKRD